MTGTVAPGKQRVIVLKKRTCLMIESPTINVVGGKRGRGGAGRVSLRSDGDRELSGCCGLEAAWREEDPSEWHRTAFLSSLRRADKPAGRDALRPGFGHSEAAGMEMTARVDTPAGVAEREEPARAVGKGPPARAAEEEAPAGRARSKTATGSSSLVSGRESSRLRAS